MPLPSCPLVPVEGQIWKHYKGGRYRIIAMAEHTETHEPMVVYQPEDITGSKVYVRPLSVWNSYVTLDLGQTKRFKLVVKANAD